MVSPETGLFTFDSFFIVLGVITFFLGVISGFFTDFVLLLVEVETLLSKLPFLVMLVGFDCFIIALSCSVNVYGIFALLFSGSSFIDSIICSIFFISSAFAPAFFSSFKNPDNLHCTSIGFILSQRIFFHKANIIARVGSENACLIIGKSTIEDAIFCIVVGGGVLPLYDLRFAT